MSHLNEFGKGEIVKLYCRRKTRIRLKNGKFKIVNKGYKLRDVYYYGFDGWISVFDKNFDQLENVDDWKAIPKNPKHHNSCIEYAKRRTLWLNGEISIEQLNDYSDLFRFI